MDSDCCSRMGKGWHHCKNRMAHWGVQKYVMKYAPFYQTRKFIGAKFGTAFEAYFTFAYSLIILNIVIAAVWFVFVVLPQMLLMTDADGNGVSILSDLINTFKICE